MHQLIKNYIRNQETLRLRYLVLASQLLSEYFVNEYIYFFLQQSNIDDYSEVSDSNKLQYHILLLFTNYGRCI